MANSYAGGIDRTSEHREEGAEIIEVQGATNKTWRESDVRNEILKASGRT